MKIRIATRKSPLAVWQAEHVAARLVEVSPGLEVELVRLTTKGDKILDQALSKVGGKDLFVKEIEAALLDGRAEVADGLDGADQVLAGSITEALAAAPPDQHSRAVMVTRNVDLDVQILPALLATPIPTIGLMGSNRRWSTTRQRLLDAGVDQAELARVHSPIGVEIAAETPAEIAVSILAQVIGQERGG